MKAALQPKEVERGLGRRGRLIFGLTTIMLALVFYVLLYPVCFLFEYFGIVSSEHGIGQVLYVLFMPLACLDGSSETASTLFAWLADFYLDLFFPFS